MVDFCVGKEGSRGIFVSCYIGIVVNVGGSIKGIFCGLVFDWNGIGFGCIIGMGGNKVFGLNDVVKSGVVDV